MFKFPLSSTSAKTGFKPKFRVQLAEIMKDLGETITSSPFSNLKLLKL